MVGYLFDSMDLLRSLSRFPSPVSRVFTGDSTHPRMAARLSPPVISPVTVVVVPVKSPTVAWPSKLNVPEASRMEGIAPSSWAARLRARHGTRQRCAE